MQGKRCTNSGRHPLTVRVSGTCASHGQFTYGISDSKIGDQRGIRYNEQRILARTGVETNESAPPPWLGKVALATIVLATVPAARHPVGLKLFPI